jgi:hypothetical protein
MTQSFNKPELFIKKFWRGTLSASASLQGICSEEPHLHALFLASAVTLTRE